MKTLDFVTYRDDTTLCNLLGIERGGKKGRKKKRGKTKLFSSKKLKKREAKTNVSKFPEREFTHRDAAATAAK